MRLPVVDPLPATMGGHRLVRVLGRDAIATTALVHAGGEARVARVFHRGVDDAVMEAELAVHDALASGPAEVRQHVAALDDLLTLADGRLVLLLAAATGPTLHDLLSARHGDLEPGEAVTTLAPLVAVVEGAHEVGVTGVPLDPRRIRFAASGAPVVVSVAGAMAGPVLPARLRTREPGYDDDHRAVARLLRVVAAATQEPVSASLSVLAPTARGDRATAAALFDLARPIPIRLDERGAGPSPSPTVEGALESVAAPPESVAAPPEHRAAGETAGAPLAGPTAVAPPAAVTAVASALVALGLPTRISNTVVRAVGTTLEVRRRLAAALRAVHSRLIAGAPAPIPAAAPAIAAPQPARVRRPFVIAGAGGGLALALAILVTTTAPAAGDAGPLTPTPSSSAGPVDLPTSSRAPRGVAPDAPDGAGAIADTGSAPDGAGLPESAVRPEPGQWRSLVTELVRRWGECRASLTRAGGHGSEDCAAGVTHPGSAAPALLHEDDPRHGVLASWLAQQGDVVVVQRMGAAVFVDLVDPRSETTAASLLLMRSEAGWRVRDVLD
ncbi:MAG: hypothetical protein ACO1N6_07050 [Microcella sp.]